VQAHLLDTINPVIRAASSAFAGGINGQANLDSDVITTKVKIKTSDWTNLVLTSPFIPFDASGNSWPIPSYRKDAYGTVQLRGLYASATSPAAAQKFADIPAWISPIGSGPQASGGFGRLFFSGGQGNAGGAPFMVRLDVDSDQIRWTNVLVIGPTPIAAGGISYGSLDGMSWQSTLTDPEPPPGFPLTVIVRKGRIPYRVDICQVVDSVAVSRGQTQRQHALPYSNPSLPGWRYLGESEGLNRIAIDSISGLALGRQYSITLQVWYAR
jgi:hypothetical protein